MAKKIERLSTSEFAKLTGVPTASITKLIRDGKLKAVKEGRKWMIAKSQSKLKVLKDYTKTQQTAAKKKVKAPKSPANAKAAAPKPAQKPPQSPPATQKPKRSPRASGKTFSVAEFSAMTYLTDYGVIAWLKQGRLEGSVDDSGQWRVAASSLDLPNIKRLQRS